MAQLLLKPLSDIERGKKILKKNKFWLFVSIFLSLFIILTNIPASAIPTLQLDILDGTYDYSSKTIIAPGESFTLYAYLIPNRRNSVNDDYYISAAIVPKTGPAHYNLGSFVFGSSTISVTSDMTYGVPPLETIVALQGWDAGDLPKHGIYPTYFSEFEFNFNNNSQISPYNTKERAKSGGSFPTSGSGMYYVTFSVDTSGLNSDYVVHFDLYNTKIKSNGDIDVTQFAPFSHDAQSTQVPEPSSLVLLGSGLIGFAIWRRKRFYKKE